MAAKKKTKSKPPSFEAALEELEQLVEKMEDGDLELEDALKSFERGIALLRTCQDTLKDAELRVRKLVQERGGEALASFESPEE